MNKHDYTGKTIFVGIDVHKKTYSVAVICDGICVKRDTMLAEPSLLLKYLRKYFVGAKIKSAYEAGFSGFGLHRFLCENGIKSIVVHAAAIEISSRDRVKTDKRDALKIAVQLAAGRLKGIYVPSPEIEDRRELTRLRTTFVKDRSRVAARIKLKANYYNFIGPSDDQKICKQWIKTIREKSMARGLKYAMEALIKQWESFSEQIKEIDEELKKQAAEDAKHELVYRSAPGVGGVSARVLANELGDCLQFSSEKGLFSYTGLTPSEYSSGEHVRKGRISRQGKPVLRRILVQCSWIAIRQDEELREIFERIAKKAGVKRAIVAIARRLIGRIRGCFQNRELYLRRENERQVA